MVVLGSLLNWLEDPEQESLRKAFVAWIQRIGLKRHIPEIELHEIHELQRLLINWKLGRKMFWRRSLCRRFLRNSSPGLAAAWRAPAKATPRGVRLLRAQLAVTTPVIRAECGFARQTPVSSLNRKRDCVSSSSSIQPASPALPTCFCHHPPFRLFTPCPASAPHTDHRADRGRCARCRARAIPSICRDRDQPPGPFRYSGWFRRRWRRGGRRNPTG